MGQTVQVRWHLDGWSTSPAEHMLNPSDHPRNESENPPKSSWMSRIQNVWQNQGRGWRPTGMPTHCWQECKSLRPLCRAIWQYLEKPSPHVCTLRSCSIVWNINERKTTWMAFMLEIQAPRNVHMVKLYRAVPGMKGSRAQCWVTAACRRMDVHSCKITRPYCTVRHTRPCSQSMKQELDEHRPSSWACMPLQEGKEAFTWPVILVPLLLIIFLNGKMLTFSILDGGHAGVSTT